MYCNSNINIKKLKAIFVNLFRFWSVFTSWHVLIDSHIRRKCLKNEKKLKCYKNTWTCSYFPKAWLAIDKRVDLRGVGGKTATWGISDTLESRADGATLFRREALLLGVRAMGSGVSKEIKSGIRLLRFFDFLPADLGWAEDDGVTSSENLIFEAWAGVVELPSGKTAHASPAFGLDPDCMSMVSVFSSDSIALLTERNRADDFRVFCDSISIFEKWTDGVDSDFFGRPPRWLGMVEITTFASSSGFVCWPSFVCFRPELGSICCCCSADSSFSHWSKQTLLLNLEVDITNNDMRLLNGLRLGVKRLKK